MILRLEKMTGIADSMERRATLKKQASENSQVQASLTDA
jgi:hypothetical protein